MLLISYKVGRGMSQVRRGRWWVHIMDPVHGTRPWAVVDPFEVYWMRSKAPSDAEPTHHFEVLELIKVMGGLG